MLDISLEQLKYLMMFQLGFTLIIITGAIIAFIVHLYNNREINIKYSQLAQVDGQFNDELIPKPSLENPLQKESSQLDPSNIRNMISESIQQHVKDMIDPKLVQLEYRIMDNIEKLTKLHESATKQNVDQLCLRIQSIEEFQMGKQQEQV